ncbi:MAG: cell division ATP-binding protein FtsE [Clostridia bacterium]|nr:cell division ATP-binding protein FtsE [Clostridia bacterium]
MIQLKNVNKKFANGHVALNDVSLDIENGEFVFLVGTSGAGKSTIIKLMMKELELDSGKLLIDDKDVAKLKRSQIPILRRKMGVVFQDFRLLQDKTVYENVAFAMEVVEASQKEIRRHVPMMLSMVGLSKKSKQYPNQLSGGEQQRVSIARAMVNSPSILVADEPTGNLDPEMSWEIMKLFNEINQKGTTVLMATHDLTIVDRMKKRVVEISDGNIIRDERRGGYFSENQNH